MRYPMLNNWLVFFRKNQYEYDVHDCLYDEDFTMGSIKDIDIEILKK